MQTRVLLYLVVLLFYFAIPVEGCMKVGISARATYAIIGACVIFSPILLVGGAGYAAVVGTTYGVEKAKRANKRRQSKKRTSNLLGKQRNRMVKKVGAQNFDKYLQDMFDKCKLQVDSDSFLELATALFFNNDLTGSLHWLNKALSAKQSGWDKTGHTHFVRGLVNQYLFDFGAAVADYSVAQLELPSSAPEQQEGAAVPILTVADAMNAKGYAKMQTALYSDGDGFYLENRKYVDDETRLKLLAASIADISNAINNSDELQGMFYHNRGYSRYHKSIYLQDPQEKEQELLRAIEDYDTAIGSGNFGTTAEAHAMKSQALAMLKRMDEAGEEARIAEELDSKVFLVNLEDENELKAPWPLPRDKYKGQNTLHYFSENTFLRPHYCDYCSQLIMPGVSYICYKCGLRAHKQCHPKVKGKDCWGSLQQEYIDKMQMMDGDKETLEKEEKEEKEEGHQHTHQLRATHFHKPTWCNLCLKFIASPIGKQGYQCVDCNMKMHKNCLVMAGNYFIEDEK